MSWASRRRTTYLTAVSLFFIVVIGVPALSHFLSIEPTCFDGTRNGGETAPDKGGPCLILDERVLTPYAVKWARSFKVRAGLYTAVAYIENPNPQAGVAHASYRFGLYDSQNVLVAEASGEVYIMPGGMTPVLEVGIDTGNREVVHTYLQITDEPLVWKRMTNPASAIKISNQQLGDNPFSPRIEARVLNTSLDKMRTVSFIAVVFDPRGNAIAASGTAVPELLPDDAMGVAFSWPAPFTAPSGRIDIIPLLPPVEAPLRSVR